MLSRRDQVVCDINGFCEDESFFSAKSAAIRFGIFTGIFLLIVGYFVLGYWHAKQRVKKGKPLLRYHRWMMPAPRQNPVGFYTVRPQQPVYNSNADPNSYYGNFNAPPAYSGDMPPMYTGTTKDLEASAGTVPAVPAVPQPAPARPSNGVAKKLQFWRK